MNEIGPGGATNTVIRGLTDTGVIPRSRIAGEVSSLPSFSEVLKAGATLASLEAMRDEIGSDLESCESMRDKAALYLRLSDVLARIEELKPPAKGGDAVDEIAARRAARRSGTA